MSEKIENFRPTIDRNIEKPPVMYHGSINGEIEEFEPRTALERPNEEAKVYATPDIDIALMSMVNRFVSNGGVVNGRRFACIPMTESEFTSQDQGGYLYEIPADSFRVNDGIGLGNDEWVSTVPVAPTRKTYFPSLYETLLKQGTEVYFIKPEQIAEIKHLQDDEHYEQLEKYLDGLKS
jgi:hypothetical protein